MERCSRCKRDMEKKAEDGGCTCDRSHPGPTYTPSTKRVDYSFDLEEDMNYLRTLVDQENLR